MINLTEQQLEDFMIFIEYQGWRFDKNERLWKLYGWLPRTTKELIHFWKK